MKGYESDPDGGGEDEERFPSITFCVFSSCNSLRTWWSLAFNQIDPVTFDLPLKPGTSSPHFVHGPVLKIAWSTSLSEEESLIFIPHDSNLPTFVKPLDSTFPVKKNWYCIGCDFGIPSFSFGILHSSSLYPDLTQIREPTFNCETRVDAVLHRWS